ncbi:Hpt domain-containing protein [Massilia sp. TS11]|uniref:Hpt domain-containing protein n=1 Tax=Massilia sp. TS11 TaxID=2908003 RepID=UPI001EDB0E21|nr:Hpt domain-containing protein [Massilia sp. TS11]MCG2584633.1 Hpt domain-containing protein [Massilia sp. TS11]
MSVQNDPAFQARLRALSEQFAKTIPVTLDQLRTGRAMLADGSADEACYKQVLQALHAAAGSAATFGYPEFGQQARLVEHALLALRAAGPVAAADLHSWLASLDRFIAWAEQDPQAPFPAA